MNLLTPRGYQLLCHAAGLMNAWSMVDNFYDGNVLLGLVSGAVMLMVARASDLAQRAAKEE